MKEVGLGILRCIHKSREDIIDFIRTSFYDYGINYFEVADFYLNGECESIMREALSIYSRDQYQLCAKFSNVFLMYSNDRSLIEEYFNERLIANNTEYFDVFLVQGLNRYNKLSKCFIDFLNEMKSLGKIKSLGFSFHDSIGTLKKLFELKHDWDLVQIKLNYYDWYSELGKKDIYDYLTEKNIPITVMCPLGSGLLANPVCTDEILKYYKSKYQLPEQTSYISVALRFFNCFPNVKRILIGATNTDELDYYLHMLSSDGFTKGEFAISKAVTNKIQSTHFIKCIDCKYCEKECGLHIPISDYFKSYNDVLKGKNKDHYNDLIVQATYFSCIECNKCVKVCPQHIPIPIYLKKYMINHRL